MPFLSSAARAQNVPEPKRERLLNSLRVILWPRPGDPQVMLKLRVHSGAAFDLAGKAGTMALMGDVLFPDPTTREFFTEDLGGRLEVTTDYDALNITMTGSAAEFERIVDLLRTALTGTPFTAETVLKLREARAKVVRETGNAPAILADRALATRLFGDYPYGRPYAGDIASLMRIERPDIMFARERFLNPDNATLVVTGGVDERRAMRALRQLLGVWRKGDKSVPATFRQPEQPDARTLMIDLPGAETAEIRLGARGLARSDSGYASATLLALLVRDRWQAAFPELDRSAFFVRHEPHLLSGSFLMGAALKSSMAAKGLTTARETIRALAATPPTAAELERVKGEAIAVFNKQTEDPSTLADLWLDGDTYKLASLPEQARALSAVTPSDVQRTAAKLFRDAPVVSLVVGHATQIASELERAGGAVEISGAAVLPTPSPTPSPAKKP